MAGQLLASLQDINGWLADDKLEANDANTKQFQIDAWRTIRGQLASSFLPTILASWTDPTTTPDQIRGIASKIIAANLYKKVYSEDSAQVPQYAQDLYQQAIADLAMIRSGALTVVDINDNPIGINQQGLDTTDFYPNDGAPGPYFKIADIFG